MSVTFPPRSWLFVPGDSARKAEKALNSGADAIILDLEDSVAPDAKDDARRLTQEFVAAHRDMADIPQLWVRVNPLDTPICSLDIKAAIAAGANGLVLPKAEGAGDVAHFAASIDVVDPLSRAQVLAIVTETPRAVLRLPSFAEQVVPRLSAMTWGAEDLATAIGATGNKHADGRFHDAFLTARSLALIAAHAAGVQAVDTLHADFRDEEGLRISSEAARREGFSGRLAIHPAQVPIINAAFCPTEAEVAFAKRIVMAFAEADAAGTIGIDGKMIDRPHLVQAEALLARHAAFSR
jgi:citrate lyase subunit beta / citryl-CoA lyase